MSSKVPGEVAGVGCGCYLMILALNLALGGLCTEYCIEYWMTFAKGQPVDIPFLPCAIGGLFIGQFTIPAAVMTWLISFCM